MSSRGIVLQWMSLYSIHINRLRSCSVRAHTRQRLMFGSHMSVMSSLRVCLWVCFGSIVAVFHRHRHSRATNIDEVHTCPCCVCARIYIICRCHTRTRTHMDWTYRWVTFILSIHGLTYIKVSVVFFLNARKFEIHLEFYSFNWTNSFNCSRILFTLKSFKWVSVNKRN